MILSADPRFAGYERWLELLNEGREPTVYLDGLRLAGVVAANDRSGRVIVVARRLDGSSLMDSSGRPTVVALDGVVEIRVPLYRPTLPGPDGFA